VSLLLAATFALSTIFQHHVGEAVDLRLRHGTSYAHDFKNQSIMMVGRDFVVVGDDNTIDADCGEPAFVAYSQIAHYRFHRAVPTKATPQALRQLFEGRGPGGTWAQLLRSGHPLKIYDTSGALRTAPVPYARIGVAILQFHC